MALKPLLYPTGEKMRVAGLMSGSGSNLRKIIGHERKMEEVGTCPYEVVVIFTENPSSNASLIGELYDLPVVVRDLSYFYRQRQKPRKDLEVRAEFDLDTAEALKPFYIDVAAYAGYMSIATAPLINSFLGVNVHPADLSIMLDGRRKYTGDKAVRDAILTGETEIRATTHIIEPQVDYGRILMISRALPVELPGEFNPSDQVSLKRIVDEHQNRLKEVGDWEIFPTTLQYLAEGRYSQNEQGSLYFDGNPIPQGVRL